MFRDIQYLQLVLRNKGMEAAVLVSETALPSSIFCGGIVPCPRVLKSSLGSDVGCLAPPVMMVAANVISAAITEILIVQCVFEY